MLGGTLKQLAELPFECRQIQAELLPSTPVNLLQQPRPVLFKLLDQRRCILRLTLVLVLRSDALHRLRPQAHTSCPPHGQNGATSNAA